MKILVTGAASFAGINLFEHFAENNVKDVVAFFSPETAHYPERIAEICKANGYSMYKGDIRRVEDVRRAMKGCDVVFHKEAIIEAPISVEKPLYVHDINVNGCLNVLECAREANCKVMLTSSNISYGNEIYSPIDENHPQNPTSPYGATRAASEKYAISYYHTYGLPVVICRFSNLYGPYGKGVINVFIDSARRNEKITIRGGGTQTRTYTYIKDAIMGESLALDNKKAIGQVYNISGPDTANLLQIVEVVSKYFPNLEIEQEDNWKGDITSKTYGVSNEKARMELGFEPQYSLERGIREIVESGK